MEEIKEVLVGEVNTSPSNEEKKLRLKKGLLELFRGHIIDRYENFNHWIRQVEYYKHRHITNYGYKIELGNDLEYKNIVNYNKNTKDLRRQRIFDFRSCIQRFLQDCSHYRKEVILFNTNRFKAEKKFIRESIVLFDSMASILDSTYGQDKWDTYNNSIVIHFTDFYITNGQSKNYMKDLYVLLSFNMGDKQQTIDLEGIRATVSPMEFIKSYGHSHLSNGCFCKGHFCLGSGPISQTKYLLMPGDYTEDIFQLFLYQLNDYVKWESIQGGPYRRINSIYANTKVNYAKSINLDHAYKQFIANKCKFEIIVNNNSVDVKLDEKDLSRCFSLTSRDYRCVKFEGKYYNPNLLEDAPSSFRPRELLTFQNKLIKSKVELSTNAEYSYETTTNPRVIWYIKERLIASIEQKAKATRSTDGTKDTSSVQELINV